MALSSFCTISDSNLSDRSSSQWGTADTDIKVPSAENAGLSKVLSLKPGVGQSIALHALTTVRNSVFLSSAIPGNLTSFSPNSLTM